MKGSRRAPGKVGRFWDPAVRELVVEAMLDGRLTPAQVERVLHIPCSTARKWLCEAVRERDSSRRGRPGHDKLVPGEKEGMRVIVAMIGP